MPRLNHVVTVLLEPSWVVWYLLATKLKRARLALEPVVTLRRNFQPVAHHPLHKHRALLTVTCRLSGRIGDKRNEAVYLFVGHGKSLAIKDKEIPRRTYNAGGFPFTTSG